jgi:hypothetical protein
VTTRSFAERSEICWLRFWERNGCVGIEPVTIQTIGVTIRGGGPVGEPTPRPSSLPTSSKLGV